MRLLSLRPDDLLTIPGMALSIDSMRFVSSAHATLATGVLTFTLVGLLPLSTSAFCWTCDWASHSLRRGVRSSNHDRRSDRRDGPMEGDVKRHFSPSAREGCGCSRASSPGGCNRRVSWLRFRFGAFRGGHSNVATAPDRVLRNCGKRKRLQSWQPWSYQRLVAYSFVGLSEGA
jgi:hypothetical protein